MKKTPVPPVKTGSTELDRFVSSVKTNIDRLTGQQADSKKLAPLPQTATLTDVINAVNALIERHGQ